MIRVAVPVSRGIVLRWHTILLPLLAQPNKHCSSLPRVPGRTVLRGYILHVVVSCAFMTEWVNNAEIYELLENCELNISIFEVPRTVPPR